jgi:hypothetical protein
MGAYLLPTPIPLWPRVLLRTGQKDEFLDTMWGHGRGGSLCAWTQGIVTSLVAAWLNGDRSHMKQEKVA